MQYRRYTAGARMSDSCCAWLEQCRFVSRIEQCSRDEAVPAAGVDDQTTGWVAAEGLEDHAIAMREPE